MAGVERQACFLEGGLAEGADLAFGRDWAPIHPVMDDEEIDTAPPGLSENLDAGIDRSTNFVDSTRTFVLQTVTSTGEVLDVFPISQKVAKARNLEGGGAGLHSFLKFNGKAAGLVKDSG